MVRSGATASLLAISDYRERSARIIVDGRTAGGSLVGRPKAMVMKKRAELVHTVERAGRRPGCETGTGAMIEVEGVSKSFGAVRALDGIELAVRRGSVQGLLGPNGAGKTTLVRILATLSAADSGRALVGGVEVGRDPHTVRTVIGLAGQYAAVDESLTGRENLVMVGRLYRLGRREARTRADETLERLGLGNAAARPVKTYSGGMRRRLDVGASLVGRPLVLLLDEPTTGLDPRTRLTVWELMRDLVADGTTVLLTTQYLEEADQLADHVVVIDRGRLIAGGTPDELKHRVGSDLLELELSEADVERARRLLAGIGRQNAQRAVKGPRICIPVEHPVPDLMAAVRLLDRAGVTPRDIGLRRPSLDDVFLALTGNAPETSVAVRRPA
jgi:daunorubicin resistance ABC transporter ATP-binding subunit